MIVRRIWLNEQWPEGFASWGMGSTSVVSLEQPRALAMKSVEEFGWSISEEGYRLGEMLAEVRHLAELSAGAAEEPLADAFTLHPLSRRRVWARVQRTGPARFYFVDDATESDVEE